ncbi:two-component sensor histidine kinase [Actinosynnema pretiosum subsp. pretiosum]|nr:two-component sensor histidine kinase [Actinosynnema pretiosum subsp. pretiosum]
MIRSASHVLLQVVLLPDRTRVPVGRLRGPLRVALLVGALVLATVISSDYTTHQEPDGWWVALFAATATPIALLCFSSPLAAWRASLAGIVVIRLITGSGPEILTVGEWLWFPLPLVAVGLVFARPVVLAVACVTALVLAGIALSVNDDFGGHYPTTVLILLLLLLAAYAVGGRGRAERRFHAARDEKAALVERARIAREMHDVVAHHMSMVVVRCETAPYRLPGLPEAAVGEFAELGEVARAAITDMQRLLGVLRAEGQHADLAPQPGLADIADLAPGARVVDARVPEAVGLTAYRVVQEALTNARRHAPGCEVDVRVRLRRGALAVRVRNTGGGASLGGGSGLGLVGMRERVAVHGGTVDAGPSGDGGFEVLARIPLGAGR